MPVFAAFQCLWAVSLFELWKRREARLALEWGTLGSAESVPDRPGFRGTVRTSMIDGRPEMFYPEHKRRRHACISFFVVAVLVLAVVAAAGAVIYSRIVLTRLIPGALGATVAGATASVINTVQIEVMNFAFSNVAQTLNKWENHRTDARRTARKRRRLSDAAKIVSKTVSAERPRRGRDSRLHGTIYAGSPRRRRDFRLHGTIYAAVRGVAATSVSTE